MVQYVEPVFWRAMVLGVVAAKCSTDEVMPGPYNESVQIYRNTVFSKRFKNSMRVKTVNPHLQLSLKKHKNVVSTKAMFFVWCSVL